MNSVTSVLFSSLLSGFLTIPWWFYLMVVIAITIPIFNRIVLKQRRNVSVRGKSDIELLLENIFFLLFTRSKFIKSNIEDVDQLGGSQFEMYLCYLFQKIGYKVKHVGTNYYDRRGDFGADLIVKKDDIKIVIQAKNYKNNVGIDAVREVLGAKNYYQCQKAMVITNSNFTNDAITQAIASGVELWNRNKLVELILRAKNTN